MKLRAAMVIVGIIGCAAAAAGIGVRSTYGAHVSVDEPQYLLTAISLAEDRSIDIADELADERYRPFHEVRLDRQTRPLEDGSQVSPHDLLLPLLLALPMEVGGWVGAKLFLAVVNGILGALLVWIAVVRFSVRVPGAALVTGIFVASAPFAVYGNQVYPEIVAALAVAVGLAVITGPVTGAGLFALGGAVVALPWLSVKYVPVAAALAGVALWTLIRDGRRRGAWAFAGGLGLAGLVYIGAHVAWYGGMTVYAAGDHFTSSGEFSVVGTNVDVLGRSRRLIGLLVDDKFGLALWQPAFLLALPAIGAFFRRRDRRVAILLLVGGVGWLTATFVALTMQGWWWPGRQTVIVLPALVLAVAWWAEAGTRRWIAVASLGALGVASYAWLVAEGLARRITWVVDFFETTNPFYRLAAGVTPDYVSVTAQTWALHGLWIALAAGLVLWGYAGSGRGRGGGYGVEPEPEPLGAEPEPEPEPDPDSEPSTSRTPAPSSLPQAAPDRATTATIPASKRRVPFSISPPRKRSL